MPIKGQARHVCDTGVFLCLVLKKYTSLKKHKKSSKPAISCLNKLIFLYPLILIWNLSYLWHNSRSANSWPIRNWAIFTTKKSLISWFRIVAFRRNKFISVLNWWEEMFYQLRHKPSVVVHSWTNLFVSSNCIDYESVKNRPFNSFKISPNSAFRSVISYFRRKVVFWVG